MRIKTKQPKVIKPNSPEYLGLYEERDERTFSAANILGDVSRADLTDKDFKVFKPVLIDQLDSDFCVGESRNYGAQATEKDKEPVYAGAAAFAFSKVGGDINAFGTSILAMCKGAVNYGTPIRSLWPYEAGKRNYYANPDNIPQNVKDNAAKHKAGSFGMIYGKTGWDQFDLFRAYLNKYKDTKKIVIHTGVDAHAITLIGQKKINGEICLLGPDSYGETNIDYRLGKSIKGIRYFTRAEVNKLVDGYIIFDLSRNLAELLNAYNLKAVKVKDNPDCFLIKNGQRHSLVNEYVALANNCLLFEPNNVYEITQEEMDLIPLGETAKFREGELWQIVQRILELEGKADLVKNL